MLIKFAIRNLMRNKVSTLLMMAMLVGALVGISVFRGYVLRTLEIVENTIVKSQFGHVQIAHKEFWDPNPKSEEQRFFELNESIENKLKTIAEIAYFSPRMSFFGLLGNEVNSVSSRIIGLSPDVEQDFPKGLTLNTNQFLTSGKRPIALGVTLAKKMGLTVNDEITLMTNTLDGAMNAADFVVNDIFATGAEEFDSIAAFIRIEDAKRLLKTSKVETLKISLKNSDQAELVSQKINSLKLDPLTAKHWRQVSELFRKVESFYDTQTALMFTILLVIVFLGLGNTVSMSLVDRTAEIGTLRALGATRLDLLKLFLTESVLLVGIGVLVGTLMSYISCVFITQLGLHADIPGASIPIKIEVDFYFWSTLKFGLMIAASVVALYLLITSRIMTMRITDALRFNI